MDSLPRSQRVSTESAATAATSTRGPHTPIRPSLATVFSPACETVTVKVASPNSVVGRAQNFTTRVSPGARRSIGWGPLASFQELETAGVRWILVASVVPLLVTETLRTVSPQFSSPMMGREARFMPDRAVFG